MNSSFSEPKQPPEPPEPKSDPIARSPLQTGDPLSIKSAIDRDTSQIEAEINRLKNHLDFQVKPAVEWLRHLDKIEQKFDAVTNQVLQQRFPSTSIEKSQISAAKSVILTDKKRAFIAQDLLTLRQHFEKLAQQAQEESYKIKSQFQQNHTEP